MININEFIFKKTFTIAALLVMSFSCDCQARELKQDGIIENTIISDQSPETTKVIPSLQQAIGGGFDTLTSKIIDAVSAAANKLIPANQ